MRIKLLLTTIFIIFSLHLFAQKNISDSLSYAFGVQISESFKQGQILDIINMEVFVEAMYDANNNKAMLTREQCQNVITQYFQKNYEDTKAKNLKEGLDFLENNKKQTGVQVLPSGLQYKIISKGNDNKPLSEDEVEVHYRGALIDGREFDSSYGRNETVEFPLNRVIKGWTEGLQLIGEGGKIMLYIPSQLAYGENGPQGSIIGPNSVLIFEIELIKIQKNEGQGMITPRPIIPPK